jgi:DNA repair protein RadD
MKPTETTASEGARASAASSIRLRPYQEQGVAAIRASFAGGKRRPLYVLPTGGGKTVTFSYIARGAMRKSGVLILVHRRELLAQASAKLAEWDVPHGVVLAGERCELQPVMVASVQTLARREIPAPGFIVIDEAHHAVAGTWRGLLERWPQAPVLGVTATPARLDGKPLGDVFDDLIVGPSMAELQRLGHLAPLRVLAPPAAEGMLARLSRVGSVGGDYIRNQLDPIMRERSITGDAVRTYAKHLAGKPALAFCVSVAHAEEVAAAFRAAGWVAVSVDGEMDKRDRDLALRGLADGSIQIVASCDLISEGLDVPGVAGIVGLRPTKSLVLFMQQVGRGMRPKPDGSPCILLDHAGNVFKHGLPTTPRPWSLDAPLPKRGPREPAPIKTCPECLAVCERAAQACPVCGFAFAPAGLEGFNLRYKDGELVEIAGMRFDGDVRRLPKVEVIAKSHEQLLAVRALYGYDPRWVHHIEQARERRGMREKRRAAAEGFWSNVERML